jgi:hypothetical protein
LEGLHAEATLAARVGNRRENRLVFELHRLRPSPPLRVRGLERVKLHADLTILAKLACALARARVVPLAA